MHSLIKQLSSADYEYPYHLLPFTVRLRQPLELLLTRIMLACTNQSVKSRPLAGRARGLSVWINFTQGHKL